MKIYRYPYTNPDESYETDNQDLKEISDINDLTKGLTFEITKDQQSERRSMIKVKFAEEDIESVVFTYLNSLKSQIADLKRQKESLKNENSDLSAIISNIYFDLLDWHPIDGPDIPYKIFNRIGSIVAGTDHIDKNID